MQRFKHVDERHLMSYDSGLENSRSWRWAWFTLGSLRTGWQYQGCITMRGDLHLWLRGIRFQTVPSRIGLEFKFLLHTMPWLRGDSLTLETALSGQDGWYDGQYKQARVNAPKRTWSSEHEWSGISSLLVFISRFLGETHDFDETTFLWTLYEHRQSYDDKLFFCNSFLM